MNNAKLTKILMAAAVVVAGLFYQFTQTLLADSYVSGGSTPTLQTVRDTGSTASGTITLNTNETNDALKCSQAGLGNGDCLDVTTIAGAGTGVRIRHDGGGQGIYISHQGSGGNSNAIYITGGGSAGSLIRLDENNASAHAIDAVGGGTGNYGVIKAEQWNKAGYVLMGYGADKTAKPLVKFYASPIDYYGVGVGTATVGVQAPIFYLTQFGGLNIGYNPGNGTPDYVDMLYASSSIPFAGVKLDGNATGTNDIPFYFNRMPQDGVAGGDIIGKIYFQSYETATSTLDSYGTISTNVLDTGAGAQSGQMVFSIADAGTVDGVLTIQGGATDTVMINYPLRISTDIATGTVTCESTTRGMIVYDQGATDDSLSICMLVASNYTWVQMKP